MTNVVTTTTLGRAALCLLVTCVAPLARAGAPTSASVTVAPATAPAVVPEAALVLHLPGIAGERRLDRAFVRALAAGGFPQTDIYDWTVDDPGLNALRSIARNRAQARVVADRITAYARANPGNPIHLIAHSGGTGVAVWALEALPADVQVQTLVLLSSALSPGYDLSAALQHVSHRAYAFPSLHDTIVLGTGTRMFGTIDGKRVEAAGLAGFVAPAGADATQYAKLTHFPYDPAWLRLGNPGDHIGVMHPRFASDVLAPLMLRGAVPPSTPAATTVPVGR